MHNSANYISPQHSVHRQATHDSKLESKDGVEVIQGNPTSSQDYMDDPTISCDDSDHFKELQEQMKAVDEDGERMQRRIFALEVENEQVKLALKGAHLRLNSDMRYQSQQSFTVDEDLSPIKDMYQRHFDERNGEGRHRGGGKWTRAIFQRK